MDFMKILKSRQSQGLVKRFMRDLESGQFAAPKAFDVLFRYQTEELKLHHHQAPKVTFPERQLMYHVYKKYPEAKQDPVALNSFKPPLAKQFALRQLQLMQEGQSEQAAFAAAETELLPKIQALKAHHSLGEGYLQLVQQEEQEHLDAALQHVAQQKEPLPLPGAKR